MIKRIVGIDPGTSGFLTFLTVDTDRKLIQDINNLQMPTYKEPKKTKRSKSRSIVDSAALANTLKLFNPDHAIMEEIHVLRRDGKVGAFSFGRSFQAPISILAVLEIPLILVSPQRWQRKLFDRTGKGEKLSIKWCEDKFPGIDWKRTPRCEGPDDNKTDSMCIAYYGALELGLL